MALDEWSFLPESMWTFDATLVRTDTDGLQALFGTSYPVHGMLSGDFHGKGTHADPQLTGLFDVIEPTAWGWHFDRARGEIALRHGEVRISNAELRLLPPPSRGGAQPAAAPGLLTGNFLFRTTDRQTEFDLTGAGLPLEGVSQIQTPRLPIGGRLSFQLSGSGPLLAPTLQGTVRLVDLRLGSEVPGSFQGTAQFRRLAPDAGGGIGDVHRSFARNDRRLARRRVSRGRGNWPPSSSTSILLSPPRCT